MRIPPGGFKQPLVVSTLAPERVAARTAFGVSEHAGWRPPVARPSIGPRTGSMGAAPYHRQAMLGSHVPGSEGHLGPDDS